MKLKNNDPVKIWSKSDHWFKSYDQKVYFKGTVEPEPDLGNRDIRTVEPGNTKSGYLTSLDLPT